MSGLSNYMQNNILNWGKGSAMPPPPAGCYVALFNGDPTDAGTGGAEVTTTIRPAGRVATIWGAITDSTVMANNADVSFGLPAASAPITHFAIYDAQAGGNMIISNALQSGAGMVSTAATLKWPAGELKWKME